VSVARKQVSASYRKQVRIVRTAERINKRISVMLGLLDDLYMDLKDLEWLQVDVSDLYPLLHEISNNLRSISSRIIEEGGLK